MPLGHETTREIGETRKCLTQISASGVPQGTLPLIKSVIISTSQLIFIIMSIPLYPLFFNSSSDADLKPNMAMFNPYPSSTKAVNKSSLVKSNETTVSTRVSKPIVSGRVTRKRSHKPTRVAEAAIKEIVFKQKTCKAEIHPNEDYGIFDPSRRLYEDETLGKHTNAGKQQFWYFILTLLMDSSKKDVISWTGNGTEFIISSITTLISLWSTNQNLEKKLQKDTILRNFRACYKRRIMIPVNAQKLRFAFFTEPSIHLGMTHDELANFIAKNNMNAAATSQGMSFQMRPRSSEVMSSNSGMQGGGGGGGAANAATNGQQPENETPARSQPPYTMHGVLHFIQHEWSRYEMERSKWEMERTELQARISFLQGERRGQENLKSDLVRRIKMLEYCLKQERNKNYRLTHNGEEPPCYDEKEDDGAPDANAPLDVDAYPLESANALGWKQGRELLKKYLEKCEQVLSWKAGQWPANGNKDDVLGALANKYKLGGGGGQRGGSDSSSDHGGEMDGELKEVFDEFNFLEKKESSNPKEDWHVSPSMLDQLKAQYKNEKQAKRQSSGSMSREDSEQGDLLPRAPKKARDNEMDMNGEETTDGIEESIERKGKTSRNTNASCPNLTTTNSVFLHSCLRSWMMLVNHAPDEQQQQQSMGGGASGPATAPMKSARRAGEYLDINDALGLPPDESAVNIQDVTGDDQDDDVSSTPQWATRAVLRSHLDCVRVMQFHPVEPVLFTAGEDGTTKLWNLDAKPLNAKDAEKATAKNASNPSELEPIYTFRGHAGAVLSMDISPTGAVDYGDRLFTGGLDGTVCCWAVPSTACDPYDVYDPKVLRERLTGHTDAVWAVAFHSSDNRLVSASADGTIKLWEPGNFGEPLLRTFSAPSPDAVPTSVDFSSTEPQHLLAAYTGQKAMIIDIETGAVVLNFDFGEDATSGARITKILSHPTMPITIMAGDDRKIRYFDNSNGAQLHCAVAHVEGISSLAIDSNGLYLLSGSHDGSLRLWNMEKRICLKEIPAHRKKHDSAVNTVAMHPSRPLIGSGGADALAKVRCTLRSLDTGVVLNSRVTVSALLARCQLSICHLGGMASFLSSLISRDPRATFGYEIPTTAVATIDGVQLGNSAKKAETDAEGLSIFWAAPDCANLRVQTQKLKTMRHPNILTYVDSLEVDSTLYLVTEQCKPLSVYMRDVDLTNEQRESVVAWGIYQIMSCLKFLHGANISHENVRRSIFVTTAGDWKMAGLHKATGFTSPRSDLNQLGLVLWELFNGFNEGMEKAEPPGKIPKKLHDLYKRIATPAAAKQTVAELLRVSSMGWTVVVNIVPSRGYLGMLSRLFLQCFQRSGSNKMTIFPL
uniref:Cash-1 n=1 Tax=Pristionchus pacificus TaxID=54126 RepID=A0A2A6CGR1_PRIPA|eukprot:PDM77253.1 cash-1 [Pristionchus pacificus]